jgi:hypothetical protein
MEYDAARSICPAAVRATGVRRISGLVRIAHEETFAGAPTATVEGGVVRREFVDRFPYVVVFVETSEERRAIMIRRRTSDPSRWQRRL